MTNEADRVALVLIGEELLAGKIDDQNGQFAIRRCRELGLRLREIAYIGDTVDVIADTVRRLLPHHDAVLTSGGVGPTHDDVTMEGIARACDVELIEHPGMRDVITARFGEASPQLDVWMRMAMVPANCEPLSGDTRSPIFKCGKVYALPGVPELFELQAEQVLSTMRGVPVVMKTLYLTVGEGEVALALEEAASTFPELSIGSYPVREHASYSTRITLEHQDENVVNDAVRALRELIGTVRIRDVVDGHRLK